MPRGADFSGIVHSGWVRNRRPGQIGIGTEENHCPAHQARRFHQACDIIQTAIAIIIRFSVSDVKPSGTLLSPPTQAHFKSRFSM